MAQIVEVVTLIELPSFALEPVFLLGGAGHREADPWGARRVRAMPEQCRKSLVEHWIRAVHAHSSTGKGDENGGAALFF